ncbi:MAG: ABC transporter permease [Halodesulfurarchaeum sp.]
MSSFRDAIPRWRRRSALFTAAFFAFVFAAIVFRTLFPETTAGTVLSIFDVGFVEQTLVAAVPIVLAALGGIFAEKSGVINIGLEGLLIVSAFLSIAIVEAIAGSGTATQTTVWIGVLGAVIGSTLFAWLFAVVTIDFKADQIIAGLAVWFIALGLGPYASVIIWGRKNSPPVTTVDQLTIPLLSKIPVVGPIFFDTNPFVPLMVLAVVGTWYVLKHTPFGLWVKASGENPAALDTAGVDVRRVRYVAVLLSGALSGLGGAGLAIGRVGQFIGGGATMVNGRGWIAITTYLFGNYNPLGTFGAGLLFASLTALQIRLQQVAAIEVPSSLIRIVPYVTVIIVLALVGHTRIPEAAGEHYESGEE